MAEILKEYEIPSKITSDIMTSYKLCINTLNQLRDLPMGIPNS